MNAASDVRIYLIGNKSELEEQREVTFERAIEFAKSNGIHKCFETSSNTGINVREVFSCAAKELFHEMLMKLEKKKKQAIQEQIILQQPQMQSDPLNDA